MQHVPSRSLVAWLLCATLATPLLLASPGCTFSYKPDPTNVNDQSGGAGQSDGAGKPSDAGSEVASGKSNGGESDAASTSAANPTAEKSVPDQGATAETATSKSLTPEKPASGEPTSGEPKSEKPAEPMGEKIAETRPETASEKSSEGASGPPTTPAKRDLLQIESTSRGRTRENGVELITFDDLNLGMQADMVFRDFLLTDRARELDGQKVRIVGYMDGGVSQQKGIKEFVLLKNTECKFGAGGQADHLLRVLLQDGVTVDYTRFGALQIEGVLKVSPFNGPDGNTWSVYDLLGNSAKTIKKK